MIYFYDVLFSIKVVVEDQPDVNFVITPTPACRMQLSAVGLNTKQTEQGFKVFTEKLGVDEASAEPIRKIKSLTDFIFELRIDSFNKLDEIKPYGRKITETLPTFVGKSRKLYFNNLDASFNIEDTRNKLSVADKVSDADFCSITLNKFGFTEESNANINAGNTLERVSPSGVQIAPFSLIPIFTKNEAATLNNGAYQVPNSSNEIIFAQDSLVQSNAIGIIQIFKDQNVDYNQSIEYEIIFETFENV